MKDGGARILRELRKSSESKTWSLKMLEDAAEKGDADVIRVLEELIKAWATIIVNIDLLINPELIVMGESVSVENTYLKNRLDGMIDQLDILKPEVQFGVQGEKAKLIGGTQLLREYVYNRVIANKVVNE
jgi:predicted NBD/HSP70 family sugar kinase